MSELLKIAKKNGWSSKTGHEQIAFILEDLSPSQISLLTIGCTNNIAQKYIGLSPSIYFLDAVQPCIESKVPKFNSINLSTFIGHAIATSLNTAKILDRANRAKKYWYINDVSFLMNEKNLSEKYLKDDTIIKFTRHLDYYKLLSVDYKISPTIVKDFNINSLISIIKPQE